MKITLDNISKYYNSKTNVSLGIQNVSASFSTGEIVAITGKSGSGKSTFLNVISLMDTFESGELMYDDASISGLPKNEIEKIRKENIAFVFQNYNIIDSYTVLNNVMLPLIIRGIPFKEARIKAINIINKVGLSNRINHKGTKLSGGEKQRCVIARALASDAKILCCDEPTGNLDSKTSKEIISIIRDVAKDKLVFIVTHNYEEISDFATRKLTFFDGKLQEDIYLNENAEKIEDNNLNLEEESPKEKNNLFNIFKLAFLNIFSTPKKSIFIFIVSLVISFSFIYFISTNISSDESNSNVSYSAYYDNVDANRILIYDKTGEDINIDDISNIDDSLYFEDALYDSYSVPYIIYLDDSNSVYNLYYKQNITDETLVCGRMPENSTEVVLGLSFNVDDSSEYIDNKIYCRNYESDIIYFTVVGYYKSETNNYITSTKEGNEYLKKNFSRSLITKSTFSYYNDSDLNISDSYDDSLDSKARIKTNNKESLEELLKNKSLTLNICLNSTYTIDSYSSYSYINYQFDITNYEFEIIEDNTVSSNTIYITQDLVKYCLDNYCKTLSVYYPSVDYDSFVTKISSYNSNLVCLRPSRSMSIYSSYETLIYKIAYILGWIGIIIEMYISYRISYLVLSRVYKTKVNDYVIFRTLGLDEKKSNYLLLFENIITILFTSLVVLIIGKCLSYSVGFFQSLRYFSFKYIFIYIFLMSLFTFFIARKINKKIFNASVLKVLKGGNEND